MPHEMTVAECRAAFLDHVRGIVDTWLFDPRPGEESKSRADIASGVAFSVLAMLDGVSGDMPAFCVVPDPHPDDRDYRESEGEDWWPPQPAPIPGDLNAAGGLHEELFNGWKPKGMT